MQAGFQIKRCHEKTKRGKVVEVRSWQKGFHAKRPRRRVRDLAGGMSREGRRQGGRFRRWAVWAA